MGEALPVVGFGIVLWVRGLVPVEEIASWMVGSGSGPGPGPGQCCGPLLVLVLVRVFPSSLFGSLDFGDGSDQ